MDFVANQKNQWEEMLAALGVRSIDELLQAIPKKLHLQPPLKDDGLSEYEGMRAIEQVLSKNTFPQYENYLGAGAYEHHVPALVGAICQKSEFLTSYTPYQAEASQGMLQATFEYQTALAALTGLDVANASLYDGGSAAAEACFMALRANKGRSKIYLSPKVNPFYRGVIEQYLFSHSFTLHAGEIDSDTAAVVVQNPNFFGEIEDVAALFKKSKEQGAICILIANPLVYGLFASAGELGADIAVGDGQPFGLPLQFGGPYVGYLTCRESLVRQIPGRIVGETVDAEGKRGYVLTLQAREQHIRREKATSNICTNQALAALACLVALSWYGKHGVRDLALTNYQRAHYLHEKLIKIPGISPFSQKPFFNEFCIRFEQKVSDLLPSFHKQGIQPGFPVGEHKLVVAVTETKAKEQLDRYVEVAKHL